ncbi:non-ribosomal peptide synthetase, partial [uncultured Methanobrevibacter sp.]|uniref:non-ribosomal peptide synthetase n=1 Tax=uncultured Methanobrevibacter sp. TaxID=253161 RepID=UPI0025E9E407
IRGVRDRVKSYVHHNGMTVGSFLNAVFAYTYSRFTCSDKVYYTFTEHGRHENYSQNALGMFVRTIPILVDCNKNLIKEYLAHVSNCVLDSMLNNIYPYRLLAREFNLNNDVLFEYNYDLNDVSSIGDDILIKEFDREVVSDLYCIVNDLDDGFVVNIDHSNKYSSDFIVRFVNSFKEILIQMLDYDELSDIEYVSSDDLDLLNSFNDTAHPLVYDDMLDAFCDSLSKYPDNVLVFDDETSYSYCEGAYLINQIKLLLEDNGVNVNDKVSVFVDRNHWVLLADLGVLSAGATYVPIDENHPDSHIAYMIEKSESKVILTTDTFESRINELICDLDSVPIVINISSLSGEKLFSLDYVNPDLNDVACILFTSGTTGNPKAVQVGKYSIANMVQYYKYNSGFVSSDVYGVFASVGFDVSLQHYVALLCGGAVTWVPNDVRLDIDKLNDYFIKCGVTHTIITTQISKLFIENVAFTPIKNLCAVGEKLGAVTPPENYDFIDVYGPTEATSSVTSINVEDKIDDSSVGGPDWNTKLYVLDDKQRRVPLSAAGELYISGYQVSKGYLNNPDANAGAFFDNPFDGETEGYSRMYKTGDVVRLLPDGSVGFIGRNDSQVKIRGNRVELTEIESTIRDLEYVSDVTVQTVDNNGNKEIVAYVVMSDDEIDIGDYVCNHVAELKPEYMVPSFVMSLDEIPLNVNGKVNKNALPEVMLGDLRAEYVAPLTVAEKDIVNAFENVFNQENIGVYDDFIRLGGDSLTAIKLIISLEDYNISVADVLSLRTPKNIANNVDCELFDLDIYSLDEGCPLNEPQLNVYLDILANDKQDSYLIPVYMEISNDYSLDSLSAALNRILDVHPILKMSVSDDFDVPYLIKGSEPEILVESNVSDDLVREFLSKPFDLQDALCRFLIIENDKNHRLFAVFHHIIFDALSDNVFKQDLLRILDGESIAVDDSFLKVSAYNNKIQDTDEYAEAGKFYKSMLADSDEVGTLLDCVSADGPGFKQFNLDLDYDLFRSFLVDNGVSENVVFTGVFAYTLSRFVGSDKVLFNIVENGRDRFRNFDSIGMFVNTLPFMVDCKNTDVSGFMSYISNRVYDVMRYNYYPFRFLAKKYNIDSDIIFQFLPDWNGDDKGNVYLDVEEYELLTDMDDFINDFTANVVQKGNNYILNVTYSDKYSADFVERFIKSYNLILQEFFNNDKLSDITYITKEDIEILDECNKTDYPLVYHDVLDAFNDNLSKYSDNYLVSMDDKFYTYGQGAYIADKIAKRLMDYSVNSGDCVGFLTERSENYIFSVLGILSIGGVYVPLDDNYPDERISFILNDSNIRVLIVSDESYARADDLIDNNICLLNISDIIKENIGVLSKLPVIYGNLACILYTSGTTGVPKGVKITRKAIINASSVYVDKYVMTNEDVYGLFASIGFDVGSLGLWASICAGASIAVIPDDIKLNMFHLNEYFIKHNVTYSAITAQVAKLFIQNIKDTTLKVLSVGGEKLGDIECPNYQLIDEFGPTEAFGFISSINVSDKKDSSSVGQLNYNTHLYILDNNQCRVPVGAVGELYLAGYQIADGYLNREEETKKAFLENPFDDDKDYSVLYRTGDMVRLLPDKSLGIVGRRDTQVKIRGNRVELSEVESIIREIEYVEDVTVQTIKNNGNNELVAYLVISESKDTKKLNNEVCSYVGTHKPKYMIPSFVIELDSIPLTVNGKVDKQALPDVKLNNLRAEYVAPSTEAEKDIVEAFENIFNQENISVYDDFTRLGGDSLTAIKLITCLEDYNISVADVLSLRTPKAISENIKDMSLDLDIYSLDSGCPLNESQLNVYLDIVTNNKADSYIMPLFMNISKEYGIQDIVNALNTMLEVHPILGMCVSDEFEVSYLMKGSEPQILVESKVDDEFISDFLSQPFDLHDSLCRFLILENNGYYSLFAVFHHIIFDGLSNDVFKRDLIAILDGNSLDIDDSFLKASAFTQQIENTDEYLEACEFYDSMLADSDEVGILLDSVMSDGPGAYSLDLDVEFNSFKTFLEKHGVSENILFTGVFAYALSRFVGNDNALFNIIDNGRDRFNNYDAIGMYVNTLPLLVDCKNQNISSFMEYVSSLVYGVLKYNYYPFRLLANNYGIDSNILFQFLPDWMKSENDSLDNDEHVLIDGMVILNADFVTEVIQNGKDYYLSISYCDKYSEMFIESFANTYKLILHEILDNDELSDINYISNGDVEILEALNQTQHPLEYDDIMDAFNDNLLKYPGNKLVEYNDVSYTYAESAFIASEIAKHLAESGVNPGDCVSFLVNRSELYMLCILGIVSMGAVYVPLDDAHPDDHIQFILDDVESNVVIVSDETYERADNLTDDEVLLNISDILKEEIQTLSSLPVISNPLICILYTSGTTGIPKGVKITRKSLVNYIGYYVRKSDITPEDVFALYASIGFDVGAIKSIFVPMYCGACLDIVPEDIRLNLDKLNSHFNDRNVTHAHLPTQVAKLFINEVDNHSLDVLCTGGEKLGEIDYSGDYLFVDSYGPTEACVSVTAIKEADKMDSSSIGYLLDNIKAYVLDDELRRVPVGAVGELYLSGIQLAEGYLNRDEETAMAFLDNPFDNEEFTVMYRTGDMVRFLPDGSLAIVGRRDSQVKIRGNRVELSEVESVIREIEYVEDVTVQTIKNENNNELIAYVVVNEKFDESDLTDSVCDYVLGNKPVYMVPSFVIGLDSIPLTVNGKVDKQALPKVDFDSLRADHVSPTNEVEKQIVNAFEVIFNQNNIGLFDDFLRLGGDSITAIRIVSLLRENGIHCTAKVILDYKTPYLIAQNISEGIEKISYDAVEGVVDLLPIQKYFFKQININNYTQEFVLKANRALDLDILQRAFDELCNVHDMLRAVYKFDNDGNPIQEILPVNTRICEINEHNISDNFNTKMFEITSKSTHSINIRNKLIDVNLITYDGEYYLTIVLHHLIIDGVSWNILLVDLTYIYFRLLEGLDFELTRPYPYKNWVQDVKQLVNDISDDEKQHWIDINNLLDDSDIKGSTRVFSFNIDSHYNADNLLMLSEEEYWALAIARAYKKTYSKDIIFNRESYGRDESLANLSRTIGWFTTEYPVLVDVNNGYDNVSLMKDVYSIKSAFNDVVHFGLNYASLIYTTCELEHKHCPVTFNFLSTEFVFKNKLLESINRLLASNSEIDTDRFDYKSYGITFNISRFDDYYVINGDYAKNTYIESGFKEFIENIKRELDFLASYDFGDEGIVCCLSEPQLGIYLDEMVYEKGIAYATTGIFDCSDFSIDEIKCAIYALIDKHPIMNGRVLDNGGLPLLICDSYPVIDIVDVEDYSELIMPFDLDKYLARFFIVNNSHGRFIFYDIHHIISDATTNNIIHKELNNALNNKLDDSTDLGFVFASCDSFESRYDSGYQFAEEFFTREFVDIDDVGYLLEDVDGSVGSVSLPILGIRSRVELFAHEFGITVGNLLNAVFAYTYSRFTGSDKVYYNFTEHGRHEDYAQDAVGMFIRTIPILVDCKNKSVGDYVNYVAELILESLTNGMYPFRLLAKEFNLNNNVVFEYNYDLNYLYDIDDEIVFRDNADSVSEFLCVVNDLDDGFVVTVNHLDKYSQNTAERFAYVFKEVLIQMLDCDELSDIEYISSDDLDLLNAFNDTAHPLVYDDILDAFCDSLSKYPDNVLVFDDETSYSYSEGAYLINQIKLLLNDNGVNVNDKVCVFVDRNHWVLLADLGVLSAGATYVPIDENLPDSRVEYMIEKSESKAIIVTDAFKKRADKIVSELNKDIRVINVSSLNNECNELNKLDYADSSLNDVACILFTSGTTGNPKAVQVGRFSITNMASFYANNSNFSSEDVYGVFASVGFDVSLQHYAALLCGGAVTWVPNDIRLNIDELNRYFIKHGVTHTIITTQVSKLFVDSVDDTSIKNLCAVGEKMGAVTPPNDYEFVDVYGPTEATSSMTSINVADKIDDSSVGRPDWNTKIYVLNGEKRRVPFGASGELYISGYQLSQGYLNDPEKNNEAFIDNPFDGEINGYNKMYKTGDVVRLLDDGTVGFIGRNDSQVKIRGNRVELTEIESTIRDLEHVADVTVQTVDNNENNEIVAYVVMSNDEIDVRDYVCNYVAELKPEYMVPSFVISLDEIPLNVNGKVNKSALPEVDMGSLRAEYVAPLTVAEKDIVNAFEIVLGQENISVYDDFIRLGGDSLTAIKVLSHLKTQGISVADILSLRTPDAIADSIERHSFDLNMYDLDTGCPLNESQWNVYLDILAKDKFDSYIIPIVIDISNEYGVDEICDALEKMLEVHPILGMCINDDYDNSYLIKGFKPNVSVENYVNEEFITEFLTKPFDLHSSLCRFLIVKNEDNYSLYTAIHHIVFDALSGSIFKQDLQRILDHEHVDYDDSFLKVSAFNQQIQESEEYDEANNFYDKMLADSDEVGVLLDSVLTDGPGFCQSDLEIDFNSFKSFLDNHRISENVLFTSVFAYTLSRFVGSDKVLFNIVENGRDRFNNYESIGMYVNTLPILADCKNQDITSFISYMSEIIYGVMKYNYYPFRTLAKKYNIDSSILFQFLPEWIGDDETSIEFESIPKERIIEEMEELINDLSVRIIQNGQKYNILIQYSNKYSNEVIERFINSYKLILSQIIGVNELSEIEYVSKEDLEYLDSYNMTESSLDYDDILDAFNDNLSKYPNNNLVAYKDVYYTYSEGAFVADKIAKSLIDMGVEKEDCVAFLVERSELYMFSILGILSAGAVYVPLDDVYPDERLQFILKDSGSNIVIASDETYNRAKNISDELKILNVSGIVGEEKGKIDKLPAVYGDGACILYTSGTSGVPKGVKITRKSLINFAAFYV